MEYLLIPAAAVLLDILFGDPPNAIHPVAWMGRVIGLLEKGAPKQNPTGQFIYGLFMTLFTTALFAAPCYFLLRYLHSFNEVIYVIAGAVILKLTFTIRGLNRTALKIKSLLLENNINKTRFELRALVSRNTAELETPYLASAAVESVAEGCCDSVVAPLFFYLLLGVPGAIAYRVVNTFDSMIGYHGKYEYLGKFPARFDDVLNYIPARLAAFTLMTAATIKHKARQAWQTARQEHKKTESPNAGWPMAAMAGALGVRLEKVGHYVLGESYPRPAIETISNAVKVFSLAAAFWVLLCLTAGGIRFAVTA
jgi:adenosylcobinamide-phosphate synthase